MNCEDIPEIFRPIRQSRSGEYFYQDLKKHFFCKDEKVFLVREILALSAFLPFTSYNKRTNEGSCSAKGLAERYNLSTRTVQHWVDQHMKKKPIQEKSGKQPYLDKEANNKITDTIISGCKSKNTIKVSELPKLIDECIQDTQLRRGISPYAGNFINSASPSFYRHVVKANAIRKRKAQDLSAARDEAEKDPRLCYTVSTFFEALSGHLPAEYKWNADATTVIAKENGSGDLQCYLASNEEELNDYEKKFDSTNIPTSMAILVKWIQLCNAAGEMGPLTLLAAMPGLPEGKFFVRKVRGLSQTNNIVDEGWLYFCNTRAGNAELWQHWYINVVQMTLSLTREAYALNDEYNEPLRIFFTTDGEAIIMNEAFTSRVYEGFRELKIDYGKNGPSLTQLYQPADRSPQFRNFKTGLAEVTKKSCVPSNAKLRSNLSDMRQQLYSEYPDISISDQFWGKLYSACEKIVYVLRGKWVTSDSIIDGFVKTGEHVLNTAEGQCTVDYDKMMSLCTARDLTDDDRLHMKNLRGEVAEEFRRHGRASDEFLDSIGIVKTPNCKNRDDFIYYRQSCLILTHEDTLTSYRARIQAKIDAAVASSPEEKARQKQLKDAQKLLDAEAKSQQRKQQQAQEAARKRGLTTQERQLEIEARKKQAAESKMQKAAKKVQDLAAARELVNRMSLVPTA